MTVKTLAHVAISAKPIRRFSVLINRIRSKYQGFEAPFSERRVLLVTVDTLIVFLATRGALLLRQRAAGSAFEYLDSSDDWQWFAILLGVWWVLAHLNDLYDIPSSGNKMLTITRVVNVSVQLCIFYVPFILVVPDTLLRPFPLYFFLSLAVPAILLWRWLYATTSKAPAFGRRVLIVGGGARAWTMARALEHEPLLNYRVLGCVDTNLATSPENGNGLQVLGREQDLSDLVRRLNVQEIVVATERRIDDELFHNLIDCQARGVGMSLMPDLYGRLSHSLPVEHIDPHWMLIAMQSMPVFNRLQLGLKRMMDLVLAVFALPVLGLLAPLVALAIRLDSPGPVFYRQVRSGRAGKPFHIIKFRTMRSDAEKDGSPRWATENDPRITKVGRFLRKARLDELPQVLNVLRGDMSIVGPRPERPEFIAELQQELPFYRTRLMIKPGLTGWAQIHYRYGSTVHDALIKLQYDMYYLRNWSLWLDLYVIFRTFGVVFRFKGT
ncbi:MAG: sugar transferase [Ardenticatenaceae bacterium]|nr:sugar transferase [Ardenticatenaceae bacterium]